MAKLQSYHVLCPLIDQKSFLGVSKDKQHEDIIVTLGRNVVNKYRLSDQKQIGGWTSRDHITSAVIYDKEQESYVGVFNNNTIKIWKDAENLDKIKKYKFPINIQQIVTRGKKSPLVIFSNGNCAALPYAIENRKTYNNNNSFIKESETIVDLTYYYDNKIDHICYILKNSKNVYEIIHCPIREEIGDMEKAKINRVKVTRPEDVYVVGELISTDKYLSVYILWSDSKIAYYNLSNRTWKSVGTVPWLSTVSQVSMAWMGKQHVVLIGSNLEQDGAIMVAYNIVLGVGSCKYPMKMHSQGAKLYCLCDRIILEAPNHIGMLPYVLETKRNLSSLLGSHEIMDDTITEVANWNTSCTLQSKLPDEIQDHIKLGITERAICAKIILPLLEKNNSHDILTMLKEFMDVPESVLVQVLSYTIKCIKPDIETIKDRNEFKKLYSVKKKTPGQREHYLLLNYIFQITFSDAMMIPYLKKSLTLDDTLFLLIYIAYRLLECYEAIPPDYERRLLDWCTLIIDSFYQQYLMTKDVKVTRVLEDTEKMVSLLTKHMGVIDGGMASLNKFLSGNNDVNEDTLSYNIELMQI